MRICVIYLLWGLRCICCATFNIHISITYFLSFLNSDVLWQCGCICVTIFSLNSDVLRQYGCICVTNASQGDFVANMFHGEGVYTWPNGSFMTSQWSQNKPVGEDCRFVDAARVAWVNYHHYHHLQYHIRF